MHVILEYKAVQAQRMHSTGAVQAQYRQFRRSTVTVQAVQAQYSDSAGSTGAVQLQYNCTVTVLLYCAVHVE